MWQYAISFLCADVVGFYFTEFIQGHMCWLLRYDMKRTIRDIDVAEGFRRCTDLQCWHGKRGCFFSHDIWRGINDMAFFTTWWVLVWWHGNPRGKHGVINLVHVHWNTCMVKPGQVRSFWSTWSKFVTFSMQMDWVWRGLMTSCGFSRYKGRGLHGFNLTWTDPLSITHWSSWVFDSSCTQHAPACATKKIEKIFQWLWVARGVCIKHQIGWFLLRVILLKNSLMQLAKKLKNLIKRDYIFFWIVFSYLIWQFGGVRNYILNIV